MQSRDLTIWQNEAAAGALEELIESGSKLDLVFAQIPALFGSDDKATYLGFRAIGLTPAQAMDVLGHDLEVLEEWQANSPAFVQFEADHLWELQSRVSADIVRLGFLRNMTMFMFKDQQMIRKSLTDFEGMTKREHDYTKSIRRFYSTHDLLALQKAVQPEKHRNNTLVLSFGGQGYEIVDGDPDSMMTIGEDNGSSDPD